MGKSRIILCKVETGNDTSSFYNMSPYDQALAMKWIKRNLWAIRSENKYRTSYGIKHCLQHDTGLYMGNNAFKEAMLLCGFAPVDSSELNWSYCVGESSPAFKRRHGTYDKDGNCNIEVTEYDIAMVNELMGRSDNE